MTLNISQFGANVCCTVHVFCCLVLLQAPTFRPTVNVLSAAEFPELKGSKTAGSSAMPANSAAFSWADIAGRSQQKSAQ